MLFGSALCCVANDLLLFASPTEVVVFCGGRVRLREMLNALAKRIEKVKTRCKWPMEKDEKGALTSREVEEEEQRSLHSL